MRVRGEEGRNVERALAAEIARIGRLRAPFLSAVGRLRARAFDADVDEAGVADGKAEIAGDHQVFAVILIVRAGLEGDLAACWRILQDEVDDARDGVRAILRCCAVAQDLDGLERGCRDGGDVRPLRA